MAEDKDSKKGKPPKRYPVVEWASAAVGLAITAVMFGLLAYEAALQRNGMPPILTVAPTDAVKAGNQFIVEVEVRNQARNTAAGVQVEGILKSGGTQVETSSTTIDYVPGESSRQAALVFGRDPRKHRVEFRITGYARP